MGSNSFFTRLVIAFFIIAALVGLAHMGGDSARSFFMKLHGG